MGVPLCPLPAGCIDAIFLRRVKRFSIEFNWQGERHWAHTNNSGAMLGLCREGAAAIFSPAANLARKLAWTLERLRLPGGAWVGVNTLLPNRMLAAAFAANRLDFCAGYTQFKREAKCGQSRLDACIEGPALPRLWVECKSVTLAEDGRAAFPDASSERGRKHLRELMDIARRGERAAMFYLAQREDCQCFGPAEYIDAEYADLFHKARAAGVEMYAMRAVLHETGADIGEYLRITD